MKKPIIAICYDFDLTLAKDFMQHFDFIKKIGISTEEFWDKSHFLENKYGVDASLAFLRTMIDECKAHDIKLTKKFLNECGKSVKFFDGVLTWFDRINEYAKNTGVNIEHYVISSGNQEIIEGTSISKYFKDIFGCEYLYDSKGEAFWPKKIVNYTLKTQYLFRICKGIKATDSVLINQRVDEKRVEFRNMIYIADGFTDIPCMTLVKEKGGVSIGVYNKNSENIKDSLIKEGRVNYACKSDYSSGSELEKLVKLIIDAISLREKLIDKENNN